MFTPIESLRWHVKYAKKEQEKRLTEYLEENPDKTIGSFLNSPSEWQLDSLIRSSLPYIAQLEEELKPKEKKTFFKALFRK